MGGDLISRSADVMSGRAVFAGTRVPVQTLFDYIEGGDRLDDFLADFPTVSREQALSLLARMRELALRAPSSYCGTRRDVPMTAALPDSMSLTTTSRR